MIFSRFVIVGLLSYTAISKLLDFERFAHDLRNQEIFPWLATALIYTLPVAELIASALLIFENTLKQGFYLSLILFSLFTGYTCLVLLHVFNRVPCPCGGFLQNVSWESHLVFNFCFFLINLVALNTLKKGGTAKDI